MARGENKDSSQTSTDFQSYRYVINLPQAMIGLIIICFDLLPGGRISSKDSGSYRQYDRNLEN